MNVKHDCIFFEEKEEYTGWNHCKRSRALDNEDKLCEHCRLWDSYIPKDSTQEQMQKAIEWQNMPFDVQPDYQDYFPNTPTEDE